MQLKLENLESRVERIDSEHCTERVNPICHKPYPKVNSNKLFIEVDKQLMCPSNHKENINSNKVGKIVKK